MNRYKHILLSVVLAAAMLPGLLPAQAPAAARVGGTVEKIDAATNTLTLKTDAGTEVTISPASRISYRRVEPGETDLRKAATIAFSDIAIGDRVLAAGKGSGDQKSIEATLVVDMTKADLVKKHAADEEDWTKRGIFGVVTDVGPDSVTISARGPSGAKPLVITLGPNAIVRRYSQDSVKFSDAKPSTLAEVKKGDQVRALGEKNADGTKLTAQELVSGTFKMIAAQVVSADPVAHTLTVKDLDAKRMVTVQIEPDSDMRKLPEQMARMLATRVQAEKDGGAGRGQTAQASGGREGGFGGREGGRGGGGGRNADLQQMIDRVDKITLADLKPNDAILLLGTVGNVPDHLTAVTLVAGVEPILTRPDRSMALGGWSLDAGGGGGGGGN